MSISGEVGPNVELSGNRLLGVRLKARLGCNAYELAAGVWKGHGLPVGLEPLYVELDRFVDERRQFLTRFAGGDAARQVRHVGSKTRRALLYHYQILHVRPHFFRPACLRMLPNVPGGTSTLGLPDTVTVPGFVE